jgi:Periplasmic binding protein
MRQHGGRRGTRAWVGIAALSVATVGVLATGASAQSGNAPGVSNKQVKLGFISSETGVAAANFVGADKGCKARVDAENAKGSINGRKIDLVEIDDKSSGANLTGAKDLVENRDGFAVVNDSPFAFLTYRYQKDAKVPTIGGGFDGSYYYDAETNANVLATGYSQDLLDQPIAKTITPNDVLQSSYKPIELGGSDVKTFTSNLKKYGGITGVPNYGVYTGYITCDIAVLGLQNAGKNPTRQSFVDGIRKTNGGMYNSAGLTCKEIDLSYEHFGKISSTPSCIYYVQVKNGKFVPYNGGKPITGKTVGDPAIIKKYTESGGHRRGDDHHASVHLSDHCVTGTRRRGEPGAPAPPLRVVRVSISCRADLWARRGTACSCRG